MQPRPPDDEALAAAELLLRPRGWIHRRVEQVSYLDSSTIRRRISIDFTPPRAGRLPLTQLTKGALTNFDLRDAAGMPIPMLTARENGTLATTMLHALAERAAPGAVDELVRDAAEALVRADADDDRFCCSSTSRRRRSGGGGS